jgi:hypothetical protein
VSIGSCAPTCPVLILRCVRDDPLSYKISALDQGADWIDFPIPEIFLKVKEITFLTLPASVIA